MNTRILVYAASIALGSVAILAMMMSVQEPTIVNVDILPGSANPEQEENLSPETIKVAIGVNNTIRWNNLDYTPHTLTPDYQYDGFSLGTELMKSGDSYEITFEKPGVFNYHGEPGPWIKGSIIVVENNNWWK